MGIFEHTYYVVFIFAGNDNTHMQSGDYRKLDPFWKPIYIFNFRPSVGFPSNQKYSLINVFFSLTGIFTRRFKAFYLPL